MSTTVEMEANMVELKCPRCKSEVEIDDYKDDKENRTAVFCINVDCIYHKNALIGMDRNKREVFISEAII